MNKATPKCDAKGIRYAYSISMYEFKDSSQAFPEDVSVLHFSAHQISESWYAGTDKEIPEVEGVKRIPLWAVERYMK